jgi:glycosyltransferase involved in cell wall biosynthesis
MTQDADGLRVAMLLNRGGVFGGHVIQAERTASALRSYGATVSVLEDFELRVGAFDVVHSFGAPLEVLRRARRAGTAVAVTPIWWSAAYTTAIARGGFVPRVAWFARVAHSAARRGLQETARRLRKPLVEKAMSFEVADVLLPNSNLEAQQIRADLGVSTPMHIVPNAFDDTIFTPPPADSARGGVACVGRLEPHKNQLGLIEELRGSGIRLTIAGPVHPDHVEYARQCHRRAEASVTFLPSGDHHAMLDIYRAAAVHVLPSWFETTGLSSLEAAASGCAIVSTNRGYASEYFGDLAIYCDPGRKGSTRAAVERALLTGAPEALRARISERFTWRHAAEATLFGYDCALAGRAGGEHRDRS